MRQKTTVCVCLMMLMVPQLSMATPPASLEFSYNKDLGVLMVQGNHPTQDRFEHFIRRVVVTRNQDEPKNFYLPRQESASEFKFEAPFQVDPGDKLHIEVFCSQGGTKAGDLEIPKIAQQSRGTVLTPAEQLKAMKDKDHENAPIIP